MSPRRVTPDLVGQQIGAWTVLARAGTNGFGSAVWRCRCTCGAESRISTGSLRARQSLSCGCLPRAQAESLRQSPWDGA